MSSPRSSKTRWSAGNLLRPLGGGNPMNAVARLTVAGALAASLAACTRGPDPTENVTQALKGANLNEVTVDWDGGARVAHLKGTVDRPTERRRAEAGANAADGTTG